MRCSKVAGGYLAPDGVWTLLALLLGRYICGCKQCENRIWTTGNSGRAFIRCSLRRSESGKFETCLGRSTKTRLTLNLPGWKFLLYTIGPVLF